MPQLAASSDPTIAQPSQEHSVPLFWPLAAAANLGNEALAVMQRNVDYALAVGAVQFPPAPEWATPNTVRLNLATMRLREFGQAAAGTIPVVIDAPYAGHSATIADYAEGQSLVQTMLGAGAGHVLVTDWKSATQQMRYFDIDTYLAALNVVVDDLGGVVHLVGLCQGGWLSAMYAARFPGKVKSLVLAGSPIDTDGGDGPIKRLAHRLPMGTYQDMVDVGNGLMLGNTMLTGWKNMHPVEQYANKYVALYQHLEDRNYIARTEKFESWYEHALDLPGAYYLQAIGQLFKQNRFARGEFVGLGRQLSLRDITIPVYLLAGTADDITTPEQVFNAAALLGTPAQDIVTNLVPGGHIGLFMGSKTLRDTWPGITAWIMAHA
jgi:polyhydroxyalkanoate depolymerase